MKNKLIIHPIVLGLYPPIFLYINNSYLLFFLEIAVPLTIILISAAVFWVIFFHLTKDIGKAATITTCYFLLFFSYGLFFQGIADILHQYFGIGKISVITLDSRFWLNITFWIWIILYFILTIIIIRSNSSFITVNYFLNIMSIVIIILGAIRFGQTFNYRSNHNIIAKDIKTSLTVSPNILPNNKSEMPNIYYIILDGYGRADVLQDIYHLNNSEFIMFLNQKGFYVAEESHANYGMTLLSLSSSLNMIYLNEMGGIEGDNSRNMPPITSIRNNTTMQIFQENGYKTRAFASGFVSTDIRNADEYLSPNFHLSQFQNELINISLLKGFLLDKQFDYHRSTLLFTLDKLGETSDMTAPTFTFAHILAPHPPFVFNDLGEAVYPDHSFNIADGGHNYVNYVDNYRHQLVYLTKQVEQTIEMILENSTIPPIIILQSDHGPGSNYNYECLECTNLQERMSILNAYYLPDGNYEQFYPTITPVNTFRIVIRQLFGNELPLLEDRSYFFVMSQPSYFVDITDDLKKVPTY